MPSISSYSLVLCLFRVDLLDSASLSSSSVNTEFAFDMCPVRFLNCFLATPP